MISYVDEAISGMTTAASNLGAVKQRTNMQKEFVGALMSAIDAGVGALVDADMNEESTKLQALQVQQQLGIQALSIANQNSSRSLAVPLVQAPRRLRPPRLSYCPLRNLQP